MKIIADTHAHTLVSGHAYSTMREMVQAGAEHGLEALALTEHAPQMPGTCGELYFMNLKVVPREMNGIQVLLGVELNILNSDGEVDLPESLYKPLDIVLASIHQPCFHEEPTIENNTKAYVNAMKNPHINIIGHPDDGRFPIDYETLVKTAKETNTLLEVNNSSLNPRGFRTQARENLFEMLDLCKRYEVPITTGSDAHVDVDAGNFDFALPLLRECDFPEELVVTTDLKKLKPFINRYQAD
ncbi:phosphatase [Hespellia stercorisuis]|uniref:Putative hydrolase n=1 Tax=Hespellia stercorisuis DSM 15480 TaxID=1121950 RepID=A0A1M6T432_9FIRM|nr:phosphatase [Hespellia stercorisuis]SHK51538.1 putative hydrolase [Hespellia stercorisuis DSM 15480]